MLGEGGHGVGMGDAGAAARGRRVDPVALAAAALVLVVPLTAVVSSLRHPWVPVNDWAQIESAVRDVGTGDTPLTGAPSRFGWHHPGPWPYYLLAPFYRLAPADRGLLFGAAMTNLLGVGAIVGLALRWSRVRAVVALAGLALFLRGLGVEFLLDPWNPNLAVVPLALFLVLCVEIARGERRGWVVPAAVGVGSYAVQAHLGLLVPVVLLAMVTALLRRRSLRADGDPDPGAGSGGVSRRSWLAAGAILLVAWVPPVVDQVTGDGNLGRLARWTAGAELVEPGPWEEGRLDASEVLGRTSWLLDPVGLWLGRWQAPSSGPLVLAASASALRLVLLAMVVGATVWALRRLRADDPDGDRRDVTVPATLAAVGLVAVVLALVGTRGVPFLWSLRWATAAMLLGFLAAGWALAAVAERHLAATAGAGGSATGTAGGSEARSRAWARVVAGAGLAAVALPVAVAVWWGSTGDQPVKADSDLWLRLRPDLERLLRDEEPVVVEPTPLFYGDEYRSFELLLERAGIRWVPGDHPEAEDRPSYFVVLTLPGEDPDDNPWIVAASGLLEEGPYEDRQLVLVRTPADERLPPAG